MTPIVMDRKKPRNYLRSRSHARAEESVMGTYRPGISGCASGSPQSGHSRKQHEI